MELMFDGNLEFESLRDNSTSGTLINVRMTVKCDDNTDLENALEELIDKLGTEKALSHIGKDLAVQYFDLEERKE